MITSVENLAADNHSHLLFLLFIKIVIWWQELDKQWSIAMETVVRWTFFLIPPLTLLNCSPGPKSKLNPQIQKRNPKLFSRAKSIRGYNTAAGKVTHNKWQLGVRGLHNQHRKKRQKEKNHRGQPVSPIVETNQLFVWVPHRMAACAEKSTVLPQNQPPPTYL